MENTDAEHFQYPIDLWNIIEYEDNSSAYSENRQISLFWGEVQIHKIGLHILFILDKN